LNHDSFLQLFDFPVQLLRAVITVASAVCIWQFLQSRRNKAYAYYFIVAALVVLAGGWYFTEHTGLVTEHKLKDNLHASCALASASVADKFAGNYDAIHNLNDPRYVILKNHLTDVRNDCPMYRWVYTMVLRNDKIIFSVDSELTTSKEYTPPGDEYKDAPAELRSLFRGERDRAMSKYEDKWGKWISAFVPIRDETSDKVMAVIGARK
jgi:hypothetical protein